MRVQALRDIGLGLCCGVLVLSAGCKPDTVVTPDAGGDSTQRQLIVESIAVEGTTEEPAAVQVNAQDDQDGQDDTAWRVQFDLDNGTGETSLPEDTGGEQTHELTVRATRTSDQQVLLKKVSVTLHAGTSTDGGVVAADAGGEKSSGSTAIGEGLSCSASTSAGTLWPLLGLLLLLGFRRRR